MKICKTHSVTLLQNIILAPKRHSKQTINFTKSIVGMNLSSYKHIIDQINFKHRLSYISVTFR